MREEIYYQAEITRYFFTSFFRNELKKKFQIQPDEYWFTGSGDSHCASLFGASLFNQLSIPARAFTPMELSNFHSFTQNNPCLIAISVSGKTPRVIEVVRKFKKFYPSTDIIGLTDNPDSALFKESTIPILISASPPDALKTSEYTDDVAKQYTGYHHDIAQTKTYFANVLSIIGIGLILKEIPKNSLNYIKEHLFNIKEWISDSENQLVDLQLSFPSKTIFVGSGMFNSLAQFGQYKWFEFTFPGLKQDIEEYAHTHYFTTDSQASVVFLAPFGAHLDRTHELIKGALANLIKPEMFVITTDQNYDSEGIYVLKTPEMKPNLNPIWDEVISYMYSLIIIEWLTYATAKRNGLDTNKFRGGVEGEKYVRGSFHTIRKSQIND
jgi:glucosamine 6-phosphate synthetase-like amidotransferase/phosphosugar isomerase protein